MSAWVALAVQLQTSRIFWMLDLLATIYLAWMIADAPPSTVARGLVLLVMAAALGRGAFVMFSEHAPAPLIAINLPADEWTDAMRWLSRTAPRSHVLADPGHAWKYGTSVRVAAERDVYLEEVKDVALALYSRDVAMRVLGRMEDAADFAELTPARAEALAKQYDLNYLVVD